MKFAPLALVVLFASLVFGQAVPAPKAPTPPVTTAPVPKAQPIIEAGGLDTLCQSGLSGHYNMDDKGLKDNNAKESQTLSDASACVGYVTGWAQTISGAFIMEEDKLWYVEVNESFTALKEVDALHEFIKANPEARTVSSPLVLLNVAVDKGMATVSLVDVKELRQQPQPNEEEQNPVPPTFKSST